MKIPEIAGKIAGGAKKVVKTIMMLPITIKIVSILLIGVGFATLLAKGWEILTGENTPKKVYEELEVEDISEIVEIKENADGEYYLDFADDADEKLDNLVESLKGNGPYRSVPEDLLKKMFKAEIVTQFPDLGGKVPEDSTGFQGAIDIKRVTPNKSVGEVKNTGKGETSTIEQEQSEEAPLTLEEKEIKTWQKGKKLELNSNATVYEQLSSELELPGTEQKETGYWQEKIKEGTLNQEVIIKKSAEVEYNGNYRVNTSRLTGSTIIYIEVKAKQDGEEITGYIKSGRIAIEEESQENSEESESNSEEANITQRKVASSRAGEEEREEKETIGEEGQQFTVAIAAGHSTVNPGASANGLVEQELTIQVAEKVQELIEEKYENIKVIQTGTTADNKDLDNKYRVQLAKDANPDLCIQIHFNAGGGDGVEALYKEGDGVSRQLAEIISKTMADSMGIRDRGAGTDIEKHGESLGIIASFADTGFPSVVTEGGFLDNADEANLLKGDGLDKYAEGIVNGIVQYLEADHSGYTAIKTGDSTVTKSVESKIYNMKYIKLEDLKAMEGSGKTADDVAEAIKYFSLDENNKLITLSWSLTEDGNITISENPAKDLKTDLQKYTMPFEYLLMFYIDADYEDFVSELADIVLDSEIVITLQDNITTTETTVHTYERRIANSPGEGTNYEKEVNSQYSKSEVCSTSIDLTYVDVWCVKAYQTNSYSEAVLNMGEQDEIVVDIAGSVTETSNGGEYTEWATTQGATVDYVTDPATGEQQSYTFILQQRTRTDVHTISNSFDEGEKKVEEQTDKFVDLYVEHSMNRRVREGWLFDILEKNEKTANLLDLTKYLMYLATNINYGVLEYDFSEFDLNSFSGATGFYGGTVQEKVWFALRDAGYSEIAVAAVMGNIECESGFDPAVIEAGSGVGLGLCQWSNGRRTALEGYINSKGTTTSDVNTQIEFLLAEITPGGGAGGFAKYQLGGLSSAKYDGNRYSCDDWENATDLDTATIAFMALFERPSYDPGTNHINRRREATKKYYNEFEGKEKPEGIDVDVSNLSPESAQKMTALINEAVRIANDDRYTYSQANRYGEFQYDCSSLVARLYKQFFNFDAPSTTRGYGSAYYVGADGSVELRPGDVLWRPGHVEMYIGNGQQVGAHTDGIPAADQISVENYVQGYFTKVYRFITN